MTSRFESAAADLSRAWGRWRFARTLALDEILSSVRLTAIGPLWIIVQPLVWMLAMVVLVRPGIAADTPYYALYVATGIILFNGFQTFVAGGAQMFTRERTRIQNVPLPLSLFALKNAFRVVIELGITLPIVLATMIYTASPVGVALWLVIPGMLLYFTFGLGVSLALGTISARLPGTALFAQTVMRMALFITPVFWMPDGASGPRNLIAHYNPLYHMLRIIRDPFFGHVPSSTNYIVAASVAVIALTVGLLIFGRFRGRIAVWL